MNKNILLITIVSIIALGGCTNEPSTSSSNNSSSTDSSITSGSSSSSSGEKLDKLDFYCTNDFHGRVSQNILYNSNGAPIYESGVARLATYLKQEKANNEEGTVFLNAGDLWQDTYDSGMNKGELLTKAMKGIGFEAMALGNHEFDWGIDNIKANKIIAESGDEQFTFLGCNIYNYDNEQKEATTQASDIASPYKIIYRGDTKIGLIGAIGENQITSITSRNWESLTFLNPVSIVKKLSDKLRTEENCDLVIYMLHAGFSSASSEQLSSISPVSKKPYVDAGFLGHTHSFESKVVNGIPWVQTYHHGAAVGHISFERENGIYKAKYVSSYSDKENNGFGNGVNSIYACEEDSQIKSIVDSYLTTDFINKKNEYVGTFTNVSEDYNKFGENIGQVQAYVTSKYIDELRKTNSDIPEVDLVFNNGNRSSIQLDKSGQVSREDIFNMIPFTNKTIICKVKGSDILYEQRYMSYYIPSEKALNIESDKEYVIAGIDYMVLHKNTSRQYNYFKTYNGSIYEVEKYPYDILIDYLEKNKTFDMSIINSTGFNGL